MSAEARQLLRLRSWVDHAIHTGRADDFVILMEHRLREQAAYVIGWLA